MPPAGGELIGKRALVMGIGTRQGGLGVTRYLLAAGADVTVTDLRDAASLAETLRELDGLPVRFVLGEHRREDFEQADLVVRNPGVPHDSPWLRIAREAGASIEMEMTLFFRACPAPIIGITGTKGKTTTSTLCAAILSEMRADTVLAGNMGRSALACLPQITPDTPVVIELSSWQLEGLGEHRLSPHIAVFTNLSPDHLNRYDSMDDYLAAKLNIARFQEASDWFVVNKDDATVWGAREAGAGSVVPVSLHDDGGDGALLSGDRLTWRWDGEEKLIAPKADLLLSGAHNVANALAASAAALLAGASVEQARAALRSTGGVPDRQELVAEIDGVTFINDTTATTPAAVIAALECFDDRPIILIAGGSDKGVPLGDLAERIGAAVEHVVLLDGAVTGELHQQLLAAGMTHVSGPFGSMDAAVDESLHYAEPGAVVLLSPGCASFGMFRDEFHRGQAFRDAVKRIQPRAGRGHS
ncbi:MAG TPA: UDP-N-acetylmuramoyl-L-alanine--D-glutamate ligase [Nitrolancea sp.]|nr:UDP-N-acetylmuramoyl-L-alanine--D-glutamate ligase [Nitrolancea sp.]